MRLLLNGRFLSRPVTGVERLAIELTRALRALLQARGMEDITIATPPGISEKACSTQLGDPAPTARQVGRRSGHIWEQTELPSAEPAAWLLSLCNVGPIIRRRQAVVICDAQFILHPESYSRAFRWWYRVLLTVLARRAAAVFTISEFSRKQLERHGVTPRGKVHVLKLGVDHLERLAADHNAPAQHGVAVGGYVLAIGSLARHKNLAMLIDAFVEAELDGVTLVVAGGGNPRVFKSAGLRQEANICYTGRVSDEQLKGLYLGALAFACPSLSEGFGFTPLEAMTAGCPVVATTGGAVPEICGDAAIYADPLDKEAWRTALQRITKDATLRGELSERATRRAAQFRWADTACEMLAVLENVSARS